MMFLNTPDAVYGRAISTEQAEDALHREIKVVVRHIIGTDDPASAWHTSNDDSISVTALTGGITNVLFMVELSTTGDRVIVRLYGNGTSRFIDRGVENVVFSCFSKWNVGPTFYGRFENGRVEGYLPATALESGEMRREDVYPHIAKAVAALHALSIPEIKTEGWLWSKIQSFILLTEGYVVSDPDDESVIQMSTVARELSWLEGFVGERDREGGESARARGRRCGFGVVLCHNDLLSGNILLSNQYQRQRASGQDSGDGQAVYLIDYEYAAYNYRAYDIANHLSEHCGFEYDLERTFPSDAFMLAFLAQYMRALQHQQQLPGEAPAPEGDGAQEETFLLGLLDSVRWLLLASHLFWGSWSTVQAQSSAIDFDYAGYAQRRFKAYFMHKTAFSTV